MVKEPTDPGRVRAVVSRGGTSKRVFLLSVDYTFGYVGIENAVVDYLGNCGNISIGFGPYAVDEGLVPVTEPVTRV